jgi:hypothetical protein
LTPDQSIINSDATEEENSDDTNSEPDDLFSDKYSGFTIQQVPEDEPMPFLIQDHEQSVTYPETPTRKSRENTGESEPNNGYNEANDISGVEEPISIENTVLSSPSDIDIFKISLDGEDSPVENLTVQLTYLYSNDWTTEYYSTFFISLWGKFDNKYLLMKAVSCRVYYWNSIEDCPPATIYAYDSSDYYIKVSAMTTYSYANGPISYTLAVNTKTVYPDDDNQVIDTAEEIHLPISKKIVRTDTDLFDWYYIYADQPANYSTNFSFTLDITDSKSTETENINGQMVYFVTEVHVLYYYKNYRGLYEGEEIIGNQFNRYDHDDPINYHLHFSKTPSSVPDLQFYIGVYVQTIGKNNNGEGDYVWGNGYCDGWAEYKFTKIQTKPMIPPKLKDAKVHSPVGKVYNTFTYTVNYFDENNDKPKKVTLTIDNRPEYYKMIKLDESDKNYQDGCIFKFSMDGTQFASDREVHEFAIFAEDLEVPAEKVKGIGPVITDNILPAARPSGNTQYIIYEDDPISYLDMNATFEDADNDTLYYRLSSDTQDWSNIYNSKNITISVVTLTDEDGNSNKFLELRPKKNMFNRYSNQKFGSEILYINVSDDDPNNPQFPDEDGNLTRAHYIWEPFELEIIIIEVNDPPVIRTPFKYSQDFINGELILDEDVPYKGFDLNLVFWDPVENDPLTYSVRNNNNIEVRFYKNSTGEFMDLIPKANWTGTESFDIIADDGKAWVADTLRVRITPVNDNPFLNYTPKQTIYEDQWFNITFEGHDNADNEEIFFETNLFFILDLSEDEYIFDPINGELRFKPNNRHVGTYKNIWVAARDYSGGKTTQYVIFEILNSPDPPEPEIINPDNMDRFLDTEFIDFRGDYFDQDDEILFEPHTFFWYSDKEGLLSQDQNFRGTLKPGNHEISLVVQDSKTNGSTSIYVRIVSIGTEDTDGDKIPDYWEILNYLSETNPRDADEDPDSDTYTNLEEYLGMDGEHGGNDDTDPNNPNEHPEEHYSEPKDENNTYIYNWVAVIIVIVIILVVISIIIHKARKQTEKTDEDSEFFKPKEKKYWHDMFGKKYEVYAYEPIEIICHNCLEKQEIQIPIRPLVVTCKKCNTRGVIYD